MQAPSADVLALFSAPFSLCPSGYYVYDNADNLVGDVLGGVFHPSGYTRIKDTYGLQRFKDWCVYALQLDVVEIHDAIDELNTAWGL